MVNIDKDEFLVILEAAHRYWALRSGGVDNWEWAGESQCDYIDAWVRENPDLDPEGDYWFDDIARKDYETFYRA